MAQLRAIFIGRDHPDNGLSEYRKLAKLHKIKLDEFIGIPNAARHLKDYDFAFVSRYLAILEALAAGVPVIAHYNNEIKKDYLEMAPFAKYINIFNKPNETNLTKTNIEDGQIWAKKQTWTKLTDVYEKLWTR